MPMGGLRMANLSPDAPPVDLCVSKHGLYTFQGPLLAGAASGSASDGGVAGLPFPFVSKYFFFAPGLYDVRAVVVGAPDCSTGLGVDAISLPFLASGAFETIFLLGEVNTSKGGPGLKSLGVPDDVSPPALSDGGSTPVLLRFLHASPSAPAVDVTLGGNPLFTAVNFGQTGSVRDAGVTGDRNGYAVEGALNAPLAVELSGAADASSPLATATLVSATGAVVTIALVDQSAGNSQALLQCIDNAAPAGLLSNCTLISH
jgi:hypothetical protein